MESLDDTNQQKINSEQSFVIEGVNYKDIDQVWKNAPITVKNWAEELKEQKGNFKSLPYRLCLHGIPGVGKTTMGLGIWKENSDWDLKMISAGDLIKKHRGAAAEKLRKQFKNIPAKRKTIILIDEAQVIMSRHSQESTDTSETTEALKRFLDQQANNPEIMVILTANEVTDMKESMKSRLFSYSVEILPPKQEELYEMFQYYSDKETLNYTNIRTKDFLQICKTGNIRVGRDIKCLASFIKGHIRDNGYRGSLKKYKLTKDELLHIAAMFKKKADAFGMGKQELSDREFQQQLHNDAKKYQAILAGGTVISGVALSKGVFTNLLIKSFALGTKMVAMGKGAIALTTGYPLIIGGVVIGVVVGGVIHYISHDKTDTADIPDDSDGSAKNGESKQEEQ